MNDGARGFPLADEVSSTSPEESGLAIDDPWRRTPAEAPITGTENSPLVESKSTPDSHVYDDMSAPSKENTDLRRVTCLPTQQKTLAIGSDNLSPVAAQGFIVGTESQRQRSSHGVFEHLEQIRSNNTPDETLPAALKPEDDEEDDDSGFHGSIDDDGEYEDSVSYEDSDYGDSGDESSGEDGYDQPKNDLRVDITPQPEAQRSARKSKGRVVASKKCPKKPRKKACKNAREFWTRWNELNKGLGVKRKAATTGDDAPKKRRKEDTVAVQEAATPMESFEATTKAQQAAQLRAHIPKGGDVRRRKEQWRDHQQASKSFGYCRCVADGQNSLLKSMKTSLRPFQLPVAAWMIRREVCGDPAGGILADDMGIGKTLTTLACISEHGPDQVDIEQFGSATLVVVPNRIIASQWLKEIQKHCKEEVAEVLLIYNKTIPLVVLRSMRVV